MASRRRARSRPPSAHRAPESEDPMADLRTNFLGVKSPNPFWLASAPPTDRKVNVEAAFRAGWGGLFWRAAAPPIDRRVTFWRACGSGWVGVVWKTLGEAGPPIVNVSGARYGA